MIDFIVENWRLIAEFVLLIVSIVLLIVKKKPLKLVDSVKTMIISALPDVIKYVEANKYSLVERRKLSSNEKLTMALSIINGYLVDQFGLTESELPLYHDFIVHQIEAILSTPQKKGEQDAR